MLFGTCYFVNKRLIFNNVEAWNLNISLQSKIKSSHLCYREQPGYLGNQNRDNPLVIYLIYVIREPYLKTTNQSHRHNLSWHCCGAMDILYLKGSMKLVKQCMSFPRCMYTTSSTRQHFSLFVVENWHKWTCSAHWQECLLMLWFYELLDQGGNPRSLALSIHNIQKHTNSKSL